MSDKQFSVHQGWQTWTHYKGVEIKRQVFIRRMVGSPWNVRTTYGDTFMAYGKRFRSVEDAKGYIDSLGLKPRPTARESMEIIRHEIEGM